MPRSNPAKVSLYLIPSELVSSAVHAMITGYKLERSRKPDLSKIVTFTSLNSLKKALIFLVASYPLEMGIFKSIMMH